jgi:hypothetical protein
MNLLDTITRMLLKLKGKLFFKGGGNVTALLQLLIDCYRFTDRQFT